ncbi:YceD family protein [Limnochorda sp.]|nr:hypothetical protein [Bacillota bacterium]MBO2519426.1 hypothetical protein [Bacillota bacterium]NMA71747.1 DUF177 domain-containing protein [Bacillota bacterium]
MELQVGRLLRERGRAEVFVTDEPCPPDLTEVGVEACRGPVHIEGRATSTGDGVLVEGRITVPVTLLCSRCLSPYPAEVEAHFQEKFVPRTRRRHRDEEEGGVPEGVEAVADEDDQVEFFENNRIDLGPLIREQLMMAVPMKGLCREECRGLCPICGQDLNQGTCQCQVEETDPRLAVLRDLLEGMEASRPAGEE